MKLFSKMLLMLLVAVMGMSLQSCSKEETKIVNPTSVGYGRGELSTVYYGQKSVMSIITMAARASFIVGSSLAARRSATGLLSEYDFPKSPFRQLTIYRFDDNKESNKKEIGRISFSE